MEIAIKDAKCTSLKFQVPVLFKPEGKKDVDFVIEAYTGQVVDRWWGKLAIVVDGIKAKKKMPIFREHMRDHIVGFSTDTWKDGSFFVAGKFSEATPHAQEVKALAHEGFPWQASIGVAPLKILSLEENGEHEVNGKKLKGPAEVWLQSEVFETSFASLGADDKTTVSILSIEEMAQPQKEVDMPITLESIKKDHPAIVAALIAETLTAAYLKDHHPQLVAELTAEASAQGATAERERIQGVLNHSMPGHEDLVQALAFDGKTTPAEAAVQILNAEKRVRANVKDKLGKDSVSPLGHVEPPLNDPEKPTDDKSLPVEERAKAQWEASGDVRKEFDGDYAAYLAYFKAVDSKSVKVLKK